MTHWNFLKAYLYFQLVYHPFALGNKPSGKACIQVCVCVCVCGLGVCYGEKEKEESLQKLRVQDRMNPENKYSGKHCKFTNSRLKSLLEKKRYPNKGTLFWSCSTWKEWPCSQTGIERQAEKLPCTGSGVCQRRFCLYPLRKKVCF